MPAPVTAVQAVVAAGVIVVAAMIAVATGAAVVIVAVAVIAVATAVVIAAGDTKRISFVYTPPGSFGASGRVFSAKSRPNGASSIGPLLRLDILIANIYS
jgi:hypothetical protein